MSGTYLPGDSRQRIQDLIKDSSITQTELAGIIGLSESAFSRYLFFAQAFPSAGSAFRTSRGKAASMYVSRRICTRASTVHALRLYRAKYGNGSCFNRALIISVFGLLHKGITH